MSSTVTMMRASKWKMADYILGDTNKMNGEHVLGLEDGGPTPREGRPVASNARRGHHPVSPKISIFTN